MIGTERQTQYCYIDPALYTMWAVPTNTPTTLKICTVVKQANITTVVAQYKSGINNNNNNDRLTAFDPGQPG